VCISSSLVPPHHLLGQCLQARVDRGDGRQVAAAVLGITGQHGGIDLIGLGTQPERGGEGPDHQRRAGEASTLGEVHLQPGADQRDHGGAFVTAAGFQHDQADRLQSEPGNELAVSRGGVGEPLRGLIGQAVHVEVRLGDVDADEVG
jgi:hypothetical protein